MNRELLILFESNFGEPVTEVLPMAVHASKRSLYRLKSLHHAAIAVEYQNVPENRAFIGFSRHFRALGLNVPEIYAVSSDATGYIQQDLGDITLFDCVKEARDRGSRFTPELERLYGEAVRQLSYFQIEGIRGLNLALCVEGEVYDRGAMRYDCSRFVEELIKRMNISFSEEALDKDFHTLIEFLSSADTSFFLYRDFQSRNIMVRGETLWFIDFQSGRRGALHYDLASLLYQSQVGVPDDVKDRLIDLYLNQVQLRMPLDRAQFLEHFDGFVLIRLLQVLGAYGKLGLGEQKEYFLKGIPFAVATVLGLFARARLPMRLPELTGVFSRLAGQMEAV